AESLDSIEFQSRNTFPMSTPRFTPRAYQHHYQYQHQYPQQHSTQQPTQQESMAMDLDAMALQNRAKPSYPKNEKQKQADLANRTCFYCHKPGHQAHKDCSAISESCVKRASVSSQSQEKVNKPVQENLVRWNDDKCQSPDVPSIPSPIVSGASPVDPSPSMQSNSMSIHPPVTDEMPLLPEEPEDEPLMYVAGVVKGQKLDVMVDSGATASYINYEVVKRLNIPTSKKQNPTTVAFANGQPTLCTQYCHIRLKLAENFCPVIQFNVVQM
ncbi:hypothetical protein BGZ49_005817, partial [Haplosporangium sp. Z 27]